MSYYKTSNTDAIAAYHKFKADCDDLVRRAKAFAEMFEGTPLYSQSHSSFSLAGFKFKAIKPQPLWTKPDRQSGIQRPRNSIVGKDLKPLLADLRKEWSAAEAVHNIHDHAGCTVSRDPLWKSIGTHWGDLMFNGIALFVFSGFLYVKTSAKLDDHLIEILGSEYDTASKADDEVNK